MINILGPISKLLLPCHANIAERMNCVVLGYWAEVIIIVKNVGYQSLALHLLLVQFLHLLLHLYRLPGDGLPRPRHPQEPGGPLEEDDLDPVGHLVRVHHPVVVVQHHDGRHHAARNHEHDRVEIRS